MQAKQSNFTKRVSELVASIPAGRVMTYGQIAALCGNPRAARIVGGIAHFGDPGLPWHRVVNKQGGLARGFPGGPGVQQALLEADGVTVSDLMVDINALLWSPDK